MYSFPVKSSLIFIYFNQNKTEVNYAQLDGMQIIEWINIITNTRKYFKLYG